MSFYSRKCEQCTERSKRVVKKIKYKDSQGSYTIQYYECENVGCDIAHRMIKISKAGKRIRNCQCFYDNKGEKL